MRCALRLLENELDFLNEKSLLEIGIARYVKLFQVQVKIIPACIPLANEP